MATYLLLRNNKEQGPFTLEQIVQLGFKPYDLVWVEGKSAAWRYPGEIAELRPYAPAVEDQPFDRFYKKKEEEKTETAEEKTETTTSQTAAATVISTIPEPAIDKVPDTKTVFVSLPETPAKKQFQKKVVAANVTEPAPVFNKITDEEPVLETKYSQSLDEIKDLYKQTLLGRKRKLQQMKTLKEWGPKAAVILLVLLVGVVLGNQLSGGRKVGPVVVKEKMVIPSPAPVIELTGNIPADEEASLPAEADSILQEEAILNQTRPFNLDAADAANTPVNSMPSKEQKPVIKEKVMVLAPEKKEMPVKTTEEKTKSGRTIPAAPAVSKEELLKKVKLTANNYKQGAFGGVKNLQLTITNHSDFALDNVSVEIKYLKPSEEVLKTEMVYFSSVAPNGTLTIKVPDSNRGVKITYRISHIVSKQLDAGLAGSGF